MMVATTLLLVHVAHVMSFVCLLAVLIKKKLSVNKHHGRR